jgi:hypothetical protein
MYNRGCVDKNCLLFYCFRSQIVIEIEDELEIQLIL